MNNPDDFLRSINNNITAFNPTDFAEPVTMSASITGALIESIATTITKGVKYKKIKQRSNLFCILKTIRKHFNSLKHKKEIDRPVSSVEFFFLYDLLSLEPPNDCSELSDTSLKNKRIIKLFQLNEQEFCLSNIKELLNTLYCIFVGGGYSKKNNKNLGDFIAIFQKLKSNHNIQEDHKLVKKIKSVLSEYGIKIKDDIFKTEDPEIPDSVLMKIDKNKLYKKLKASNQLPNINLLQKIIEENLDFYEILSELADYDPVKTKQHKKELIAMVLAIIGGFVPFVPLSDGIRAGVFTHRFSNHQIDKIQAQNNIEVAINLLNENKGELTEENYHLLEEYLQKVLKLKEDHLDIKIQQEIAHATIHTVLGSLSLFLFTAGPIFSLVKSITKISSKVVASTSGAIHRNMSDNKKRVDDSFITLADLFGLIKKIYLDAVKNNEQGKIVLMQKLVYSLFEIKKETFDQLVQTDIVKNSKIILNIYHP
jgi:hypothetical protein